MKFLVLAMCVCAAAAAPQLRPWQQAAQATTQVGGAPFVAAGKVASKTYSGDDRAAEVLRSDSDVAPNGYNFNYETSNGISAQETGTLKKVTDIESIAAQGSYQYTAPDGKLIQLSYVADENGYQPSGDVLPTPPPTPEHVLRLLDFIAKNPPPVETPSAYQKNF